MPGMSVAVQCQASFPMRQAVSLGFKPEPQDYKPCRLWIWYQRGLFRPNDAISCWITNIYWSLWRMHHNKKMEARILRGSDMSGSICISSACCCLLSACSFYSLLFLCLSFAVSSRPNAFAPLSNKFPRLFTFISIYLAASPMPKTFHFRFITVFFYYFNSILLLSFLKQLLFFGCYCPLSIYFCLVHASFLLVTYSSMSNSIQSTLNLASAPFFYISIEQLPPFRDRYYLYLLALIWCLLNVFL